LATNAEDDKQIFVRRRRKKRRLLSPRRFKRAGRIALLASVYIVGIALALLLWFHLIRN